MLCPARALATLFLLLLVMLTPLMCRSQSIVYDDHYFPDAPAGERNPSSQQGVTRGDTPQQPNTHNIQQSNSNFPIYH